MENYSIFDIIGPTMIGPSSSHTAGAAKIGYISRQIFGHPIKKVTFLLHGSFATTYKGHGTNLALIAGVCGLKPDDPNIPKAYDVAKEKQLSVDFQFKDLGDVHPNTVKIIFESSTGFVQEIMGSSIGGGKVTIIAIDDIDVTITGQYATIITQHTDKPGFVADLSRILSSSGINIAFMKLFRETKGEKAVAVVETDDNIPEIALTELQNLNGLKKITAFRAVD